MAQVKAQLPVQKAIDVQGSAPTFYHVVQASDGGAFVRSSVTGSWAWMKYDPDLQPLWGVVSGLALGPRQDGGCSLSMSTAQYTTWWDSLIMEVDLSVLDPSGVLVASAKTSFLCNDDNINIAFPNVSTSDTIGSNFIATPAFGDSEGLSYVVGADGLGQASWVTKLDGAIARAMVSDGSGGCVVVGYREGPGSEHLTVSHLDGFGHAAFHNEYQFPAGLVSVPANVEVINGAIAVFSNHQGSVSRLMLDMTGNIQECHLYGLVPPPNLSTPFGIYSAGSLANGETVWVGEHANPNGKVVLMRCLPGGGPIEAVSFKRHTIQDIESAYGVHSACAGQGGVTILGDHVLTNTIFQTTEQHGFLWKINGQFSMLCGAETQQFDHTVLDPAQFTIGSLSTMEGIVFTTTPMPFAPAPVSPYATSDFCALVGLNEQVGTQQNALFELERNLLFHSDQLVIYVMRDQELQVLDFSGRTVLSGVEVDRSDVVRIPLDDLPQGPYLIQARSDEGIVRTERFMKLD